MSFMDFGDVRVLLIGILITAIVLTISSLKKKSAFAGVMLIIYLILLIVHVVSMSSKISVFVDLAGIAACITTYLIIDEVEIRRKKISQVFEDRYKN